MPNTSLARWETYSPVSIGMNEMFNRLDALADSNAVNYPPYNILKVDEYTQELQVALAGFSAEHIEVSLERGVLSLHANKVDNEPDRSQYIHRGIAARGVNRNWQMSDNAEVSEVTYKDGLLRITVRLQIPESQQRKVFPIT